MAESNGNAIREEETDDDEIIRPPPLKKQKVYKQKYNKKWEKDPQLKKWLSPVAKDPHKAFCKLCSKELSAGLSELKKHQNSKKHQENDSAISTSRCITEMVVSDTITQKVKMAEIKMAAFVVEHHLPFQAMDHLSDLVTSIFPDSETAQLFHSKHTKTRAIVKHVLADDFRETLLNTLRKTLFSIIIDETTDVSSKKLLALVVRYFCNKENRVKSQFLKLLQVTDSDATTLVACLVSYFSNQDIPLTNIVGYASDTTNVMFGQNHSVVTLLKEKIPYLYTMKCLCHSAHLCASHACEKLPRSIEDLVRDVYSHFSHSAKRLAEYEKFQSFTNTEPHKLLKPSQTRWLSLEQCVVRVVEQWPALEAYFQEASETHRLVSACNTYAALKKPIVKLYYHFLKFVLPKFTHFNKLFQSETPNLHFLTSYLASTYKAFLSCYLSSTYIRSMSLDKLDPESQRNFLPLTSMSMGEDVSKFLMTPLSTAMKEEVKGFLQSVQAFYIEAARQIKMRFPIDDDILKSLTILNPSTINSTSSSSVIALAGKFPNIIPEEEVQKIDHEWRELQFLEPSELPSSSETRADVVTFWGSVSRMTNPSGESRFPTVSKLMKSVLSLPHSNADVERVFSQVTLVKTKLRNSLKTSTLDAILLTKQCLPSSCVEFKPSSSMVKRMSRRMYDSDNSDSDSD